MSIQENSSVYVNVKIQQSESFSKEMMSSDQIQANIIVASNDEKIKVIIIYHSVIENIFFQVLTNTINDPSTTDDTKIKCLQSRVVLNFELKRWQGKLN